MFTDFTRAVRLITLRYFETLSVASTVLLTLLAAGPLQTWRMGSNSGPTLSRALGEVVGLSIALGTLAACACFWLWLWRRLGPDLEADFERASRRLGGTLLGETTRHRLRERLAGVLPRGGAASVHRAFRVRLNAEDFIVAEWSSNDVRDALALAETQLVVVLPGCETALPDFHLEPESLVTRFSEWLHARNAPGVSGRSSEDIDFKRDPEWSRRWFLCGARRPALRGLFRRRVRDVFRRIRGWRASGRGRWLVLYSHRAVGAEGLAERVREAAGVLCRFQRAASAA